MERRIKVNFGGQECDGVPVETSQANEHWNQYLLDDGSLLKLKTVVTEVFRLLNEYDADGNPVYVVKSGNIVAVTAPDHLKKKSS